MTDYTVAEARNNLTKLINRAIAGEEVVITRRGKPVVSLTSKTSPPATGIDIEWLKRVQVKPADPNYDGQEIIRVMRGDYRY